MGFISDDYIASFIDSWHYDRKEIPSSASIGAVNPGK
jgi:hypothetical protein